MSDLIDRQALLRQIDIDSEGEPGYYGDTWKFIDTIKRMPSAQLATDTNVGTKLGMNLAEVGTDCISRQQAINKILGQPPEPHYPSWYAEQIKELPSAQPEIVRCKDCDWWTKQEDSLQGRCALLQMYPTGGWFCGNARRREVTE